MDVQQARKSLHHHCLKATQARIAILLTLSKSNVPFTAKKVSDELAGRGLCRPTVSRCLIELAEVGLIRRIQHDVKSSSFELARS